MEFAVQDLHKSFGEKKVLEGISFSAKGGSAFGLLGRNGAGKTTTIRIIMDVFPPDNGRVLMDGAPMDRRGISIGYLPEEHGLYPKVVIREQLVYLAQLRGVGKAKAKESIDYWMGRLGMQEYAARKLDTLSKGNQQKIQLVAALLAEPEMLILDEPFSGLDPVNAALLKDVVKEFIASGKIVIFSSHQMSYVEEFCDSIAILHEGRIALAGSIAEIKRSYDRRHLVVRTAAPEKVQAYATETLGALVETASLGAGGAVQLLLKDPGAKMQVLAALGTSGLDIDAVAVYEPSLNDIFVHTAGDDANEGGAAQ